MECGCVSEQLATNLVGRICPSYVTFQVTVLGILFPHHREVAEYVVFIVLVLVLYPQVDSLPVYRTLRPRVVGGIIGINGYVRFQTISSVWVRGSVDKFEVGTEARFLDCANLPVSVIGVSENTHVTAKERTNASSFCDTEE